MSTLKKWLQQSLPFILMLLLLYPAWLLTPSQFDVAGDFFSIGDYLFDADPAIIQGMNHSVFTMYSVDPAPLMLPLSLVLRVLVIDLLNLFGFDITTVNNVDIDVQIRYLVGAFALMIFSTAALLLLLRKTIKATGWQLTLALSGFALYFVGNPLIGNTLKWGHPEEALMAAMIAASLLSLCKSKPSYVWSAIFLALAVATKQPAALAAPALFLAVPAQMRKQFALIFVGALTLLIAPFIIADLTNVISSNTHVTAASFLDSSKFFINIFHAFGVENSLGWLSRPLIFASALLLPLYFAYRNKQRDGQWLLSPMQATSVLLMVIICRCLFDPYNIIYYAAPLVPLLFVLELLFWNEGRHHLYQRFAPNKNWPFLPIYSAIVTVLLWQISEGWLSVQAAAGFDNNGGILYTICLLIALIILYPLSMTGQWGVSKKMSLAFATVLTLFACVASFASYNAATEEFGVENVKALSGYKKTTVDEFKRISDLPFPIINSDKDFAVEPRVLAYHLDAVASAYNKEGVAVTYSDYGPAGSTYGGFTLFQYEPGSYQAAKKKLRLCQQDKCPDDYQLYSDKDDIWQVMIKDNDAEALIFTEDQMIFIISVEPQQYSASEIIKHLQLSH